MHSPVLVNVSTAGCRPFPALMISDRILALAWFEGTPLAHFHCVEDVLARWCHVAPALEALCASTRTAEQILAKGTMLDAMRVHAPIIPRQVFCTIGNYRSQLVQSAEDADDGPRGAGAAARRQAALSAIELRRRDGEPYVCVKPTSSVADPIVELAVPSGDSTLDWEVEVGVVIGRAAFHVDPEHALQHVAGYCVVNDITLRRSVFRDDPPRLGTDWVQSKGGPGWLPVGPWFVPTWQIADAAALRPWLRLNGTVMQEGFASDMVFGIAEQIAYLTRHVRLEPGDLLCTGSPAGFGSHYGRYLSAGDVMEAGVDGLGAQRIVCVDAGPDRSGTGT